MATLEGWNIKEYREVLRQRAATLRINPNILIRFDESDLVQETLLRAANPNVAPCNGTTDHERLAWLCTVQNNVLLDKIDEHLAKKRDVRRQIDIASVQQALMDSSVEFMSQYADDAQSPSDQAAEREEFEILSGLLGQLSVEQKTVLELRRGGATLQEIAEILGETVGTIAGRVTQATKALVKLRQKQRGTEHSE